jgi:DNA replication protein DnaC
MLLLHGPTGDGKSTLAAALLTLLVAQGHRPAFVTAAGLMLELGEEYDGRRSGVLRGYIDAGALVVDDLGNEPIRRDTAPALGALADERWSRERPTVWTTNLPITRPKTPKGRTIDTAPSLEDYDARLVSRILSGLVVKLGDEDLRLAGGGR